MAVATPRVKCYPGQAEVRVELRWSGSVRRKTDDAAGQVTSVQVGVARTGGASGVPEGAEERRVRGGGASALADGVSATVVRIGDDTAPRESPNGRLRTPR